MDLAGAAAAATAAATAATAAATAATAAATAANPYLNGNAPPPFLSKTYDMVDDPATDAIVSWGPENNSFVVWDTPELSRQLLPKFFKHGNFSSFVRQLNTYGFRKVDPDRWEFANEGFLRGQKHLLKTIARRKPNHVQTQPHQPPQPQTQNAPVGPCVELGKFGVVEEIDQLKRDKNALMQELVRLRQQQQATDLELQTLGQRLQGMEQRQQQMVSFLAKAMQSPGFLAQLVHQTEAANKKKRRLPAHDNLQEVPPPNGQIIKYQPLINEAAKAMLMQILDASPRLESSRNSSPSSGVTLAEVQFPELSQIPGIHTPRDYAVAAEAESPYIAPTTTSGLIDVEEFLNDTDDPSLDEGSQDLPGIDDPFWETLLSSPASGEADEVESNIMEATKENGWHGAQNMESLTTQMGLLTRDAGGQRLM